jgi:hypothetical protein
MESTPHHSPIAATAHLIESERLLVALPLVNKRDRDHHLQLALINAVLSIAAAVIGDLPSQTDITRD